MKLKVLAAAILFMIGSTAAVVGYDGPEDKPHIMSVQNSPSSSSASASTSVGPEGTRWSAEVKQKAARCQTGNQSKNLSNITYAGDSSDQAEVSFEGMMSTPDPCYNIEHEVFKKENRYVMNITTVSTEEQCIQCVGSVEYEASFSRGEPFQLEVRHDGIKIDTLTHLDYEPGSEDSESEDVGILEGLIRWLKSLF